MKPKLLALAGLAVAMYSFPAFAHHSFSMFDGEKTVTLGGTVKEFRWTNPHSWLVLTTPNARGTAEEWNIEMLAPGVLARRGWIPKTLKAGMNVSVVIHPLRDGTRGGQFMAVTLPDGKVMVGNPNAPAGAN